MRKLLHRIARICLTILGHLEMCISQIIYKDGENACKKHGSGREQNILLWSMDRIGDVQRSTPAIRILKKRYPEARITVIIAGRSAPVLFENPWINNIYIIKNHYNLWEHFLLLNRLRNSIWDLGLLLEVDPYWCKLGQLSFRLLGVKRWATFDLGWGIPRGRISVPIKKDGSWIDQFIRLATFAGAERDNNGMDLYLSNQERQWADRFLKELGIDSNEFFFLIHPGGNFLTVSRQWPPESYAKLINLIHERWPYPILITGVQQERPIILRIQSLTSTKFINLCGLLNLRQLISVIEKSNICIINDTGPLHIAHSLGILTVVILGPTAPEVVGIPEKSVIIRAELPCSPCAFFQGWQSCKNPVKWQCLTAISPEQVMKGIVWQMQCFENVFV